jgi:hypothetical protein
MFQVENRLRIWLATSVNSRLVAQNRPRMTPAEREDMLAIHEDDLEHEGRAPAITDRAADWVAGERDKRPRERGRLVRPGVRRMRTQGFSTELEWHQWAVTEVFTAHATNDEFHVGVKAFREQVLHGQLVPYTDKDIQQWITERLASDAKRSISAGRKFLSYGTPSSNSMLRVLVRPSGELDRLQKLSQRLADRYDWDAGQATIFVLTGASPVVHAIRTSVRHSSPMRVRSRITLVVDPSCSPEEVADEYRRARDHFTGGKRLRRVGERYARLAVFAFTHSEPFGPQLMAGWNEWCEQNGKPEWAYRFLSQFVRESQRAFDSVAELVSARSSRRHLSSRSRRPSG